MISSSASPPARTFSASWQLRARAELERRRRAKTRPVSPWPAEYANAERGTVYRPHNEAEAAFVYDDVPRYVLLKGGEGGGKSCAGIAKVLGRIRRGMNGCMVSPDFEHFKRSLWPEFRRWCPWNCVIERHRHRSQPGWEPTRPFILTFRAEAGGYADLMCGGVEEHDLEKWEGPNISFALFDEARRHKKPGALKVFDGRIRIPGPRGEPPQLFITTTPRKHWLYEYFAGAPGDEIPPPENDPLAAFKADAFVATLLTEENAANLEPGFVDKRRQSLNESEARVLLEAAWEDIADTDKFLASMLWWDACREDLPPPGREPWVVALDAAKGGETVNPDCFAIVGVSRHPSRPGDVAVRYVGKWQPPPGGLLDFGPAKAELRRLCAAYPVVEVAYDDYQLHDLAMTLRAEGVANFRPFSQGKEVEIADRQLLDVVMSRRIAHDGDADLRKHLDNADVKKSGEGFRIVKRTQSLKVDLARALSMATARCLYYNI